MWIATFLTAAAIANPLNRLTPGPIADVRTVTCEGQAVAIDGMGSAWTLEGDCGEVTVKGHGNSVTIDGATRIVVDGNGHAVTWSRDLSGPEQALIVNRCRGCVVQKR